MSLLPSISANEMEKLKYSRGHFIYIIDSSNSSSINFELLSSVLALEATELVPELVTQMVVELINNHLNSVQQKR